MTHFSAKQRIEVLNAHLQAGLMDEEQFNHYNTNATDVDLAHLMAAELEHRCPNGRVDICHPDDAWMFNKTPEQAWADILEVLGEQYTEAA